MLETLIACLFIPVIVSFVVAMLLVMKNFESNTLNQHDVFQVQCRQMLIRSNILECDEHLHFSKNNQVFELILDEHRIVKTPGFEILLYNVDGLYFQTIGDRCHIFYDYKGKEEEIEIHYQY